YSELKRTSRFTSSKTISLNCLEPSSRSHFHLSLTPKDTFLHRLYGSTIATAIRLYIYRPRSSTTQYS
ncbi:hypothetical protein AALP_AAs59567U000100, partial [Arabis alpina]